MSGKSKEIIPYEGKNLIKINGLGSTMADIIKDYMYHMKEGYNLSVLFICQYIGCNQDHFLKYYRDSIKHIRINTMVREMAREVKEKNDEKEYNFKEYYGYFQKRILYERESFYDFIKNNCTVELKYYKIKMEEFSMGFNSKNEKMQFIRTLNSISYELFAEYDQIYSKFLDYVPERLYSLKTIRSALYEILEIEIKYDVQVYRLIDELGVNKIKLGNLVRYDIDDFKGNYVIVRYAAYEKVGKKKIIEAILENYKKR